MPKVTWWFEKNYQSLFSLTNFYELKKNYCKYTKRYLAVGKDLSKPDLT